MLQPPNSIRVPFTRHPLSPDAAYYVEPSFCAKSNEFILDHYEDIRRYFNLRRKRLVYFPLLFAHTDFGPHHSPLTGDVLLRLWGRNYPNYVHEAGFIVPDSEEDGYNVCYSFVSMEEVRAALRRERHERWLYEETLEMQDYDADGDYDTDDEYCFAEDADAELECFELEDSELTARHMNYAKLPSREEGTTACPKPAPSPGSMPSAAPQHGFMPSAAPRHAQMPSATPAQPEESQDRRGEAKKKQKPRTLSFARFFPNLLKRNKADLAESVSQETLKKAEALFAQLNDLGLSKELLIQILQDTERFEFVSMVISPSFHIVLKGVTVDRQDAIVKLPPLHRALYFLYLRHTEGINFSHLTDHQAEIMNYYVRMSRALNTDSQRHSVAQLTDPTDNRINVVVSGIRCAFLNLLPPDVANYYCITGLRGQTRSIQLDRKYVEWQHA